MRKLAPAFILTSIIALASGSALALGDMKKDKKSPTADTTATQSTTAKANPNPDKCKNLKPTDPAYAQNNCGGGDSGSTAGSPGAGPGAAGSTGSTGSTGSSGSASGSSGGSGK